MIAFINNLSFGETLVIGVLAILFFGKRLPEVAAQAGAKLQDLKRSMNDLRRDIGLDEQLREAQERMRVLEREARARPSAPPPLVEARKPASSAGNVAASALLATEALAGADASANGTAQEAPKRAQSASSTPAVQSSAREASDTAEQDARAGD